MNTEQPKFNVRFTDLERRRPNIIKVIGVGGGGGNAVEYMFNEGIKDVDFVICNTDAQALDLNPIPIKIQLGAELTEGMGAGADPEEGKKAAEESIIEIEKVIDPDTKMVFITAGMGGGTGTGAAPVVAQFCRDRDILTVGVVTMPFNFEGNRRMDQARKGIEEMKKYVDTLVVILNENLRMQHNDLTVTDAFKLVDNVLLTAVKGMAELITITGKINVDFKDAKTVLKDSGVALMGSAEAEGSDRALHAVAKAISSPLQDDSDIQGATNILANIVGGKEDVSINEISDILGFLQEKAGGQANIIYGQASDERLAAKLRVTVIVTGFEKNMEPAELRTQPQQETKVVLPTPTPEKEEIQNTFEEVDKGVQQDLFGSDTGTLEKGITHTLEVNNEEEYYDASLENPEVSEMDLISQKVSQENLEQLRSDLGLEDDDRSYDELEKPAFERRNLQLSNANAEGESYANYKLGAPDENGGRAQLLKNRYLHRDVD